MGIDDEDVHQFLPIPISYYEAGVGILRHRILIMLLTFCSQQDVDLPRQTLRSPNVLLDHPPQMTDSFTLYVKGNLSPI